VANLPPVVFDRRFVIREDQFVVLGAGLMLPDFRDPEGGPLEIWSGLLPPLPGTAIFPVTGLSVPGVPAIGGFSLDFPVGFVGEYTFVISVRDVPLASVNAQVTIRVTGGGVFGTSGAEVLINPASGGSMFGLAGNDTFFGGDGDDAMFGDLGDDVFYAGAGQNEMRGGQGDDAYNLTRATDTVVEFAGEGDADTAFVAADDWATDTLIDIVRLVGAATRFVFGGSTDVVVVGNPSVASTAGGGSGNDTVWGKAAGGTLLGGAGDDILRSFEGEHEMRGGAGRDLYNVASLGDTVVELPGEGDDAVFVRVSGWATAAANVEAFYLEGAATSFAFTGATRAVAVGNAALASTVAGGAGDDELWGQAAGGTLIGNAGQDTLRSFDGDHEMRGGAGDDHYNVASLGDTIVEFAGEGADTAWVQVNRWTLADHVEIGRLVGSATRLTGNATGSTLVANQDAAAGGSTLTAGAGDTVFWGGPGHDRFVVDRFGALPQSVTLHSGGGHGGAQDFTFDALGLPNLGDGLFDRVTLESSGVRADTIRYRPGEGKLVVDQFDANRFDPFRSDRLVLDAPAGETVLFTVLPGVLDLLVGFASAPGGVVLGGWGLAFRELAIGQTLLTTNPVNLAPIGVPDSVVTRPGRPVSFDVLANDLHLPTDGRPGGFGGIADVVGGSISLAGNIVTFTPNAGFEGVGGFTYRPFEGGVQGTPTRVTVAVDTDVPIANPDSYSVFANTALFLPPGLSIFANDDAGNGRPLRAIDPTPPGNGFAALGDTTIYFPNPGFVGTDRFTYRVINGDSVDGTAVFVSEPATVTVNVLAGPAPTLSLRALDVGAAPEGTPGGAAGGTLSFVVDRSEALALVTGFTFRLGGTASAADRGAPTATGGTIGEILGAPGEFLLTFAPGATSATIRVAATPDAALEPDETVTLTLLQGGNATLPADLAARTATGAIRDDDAPPVFAITAAPQDAAEGLAGGGSGVFIFTISRVSGDLGAADVQYSVSGGAAPAATGDDLDNGFNTGVIVSFAAGQMDAQVEVFIRPDAVDEPDESVRFQLVGTDYGSVDTTAYEVRVLDDDLPPPVFAITAAPQDAAEGLAGGGSGVFIFTISRVSGDLGAADVQYSVSGGAAPAATGDDLDNGFNTGVIVSFAAGQMDAQVEVFIRPDAVDEPDESVRFQLVGTDYGSADTTAYEVRILDDDVPPEIAFAAADVGATPEGTGPDGRLAFVLTRDGDLARDSTVLFEIRGGDVDANDIYVLGATFTAPGGAGSLGFYTATVRAGDSEAEIEVWARGDSVPEPDESVVLRIASILDNGIIAPNGAATARGVFLNDDVEADLAVSGPTALIAGRQGGTAAITFTVTNNGPDAGGGAFGLSSILPLAGIAPVVSAGSVDAAGIWTLPELASGDTATITYTLSLNQSGTFTVAGEILSATRPDPDSTPGNFNTEPTPEDDAAIANLSIVPAADLSLSASVTDTTVLFGEQREILFAVSNAGSIAGGGTVRITDGTGWTGLVWNLPLIQPGDQAILNFGYVFGDVGPRTITAEIETATQPDPDSTPGNFATAPFEDDAAAIAFTMPTSWRVTRIADAPEGSNPALDVATNVFRIERFGTDLPATSITVTQRAGSGPNPVDAADVVGLNQPLTVAFAAGQTALNVAVTTRGDSAPEPNETIRLTLDSVGAGFIAPGFGEAQARVIDDDAPPPVFSMQVATGLDAVITEGTANASPLGVRITRTGDTSQAATITFTIGPGTTGVSAQGDDLRDGFDTFTATFGAGLSELVLLIRTTDDTTPEPDETFTVTLTGTDVGSLGGNLSNEYTIANDDLGPPPRPGPVFYFSGFNAERGRELWVYDTNAPGDPRASVVGGLFEKLPGAESSNPFEITVVGGHVVTRVDENGVIFGDQGDWRSWDGTSTLGLSQVNLDAFDATLPVAERNLGILSDGLFWYATRFVNAPGDVMFGIDGNRMVPTFGSMLLAGEGRRGLTDAGGNPAYIALIDDGTGTLLDQVFVGLFEPGNNSLRAVQATSGDNIDQVVREIAGFSIIDAPAVPLAKLKTVYFSGDWTDPDGGAFLNGLWKVTLSFDPFLGTWSPLAAPEFVNVNATGADPSDPGFIALNATDLTLSVTGAGERLFFFGRDSNGPGPVETWLYAMDGAQAGPVSVVANTASFFGNRFAEALDIRPYAGGVVYSAVAASGGGTAQAVVDLWRDSDGDDAFTLTSLFQGGGGTVEHLTTDAEGNVAWVWDQGGTDAVFVWTPATGATAFGDHAGEVDEVQLAGGHLVYRALDPTGRFPTLYTADIAMGAPAQPIGTDEPLVSPGTQFGVIGAHTIVSTAFGVAFQAVLSASFASPFLYTAENGGAPELVLSPMNEAFNVATVPGFGFGSGIALGDAWVGTGNLGAQLGLFRVDATGVTLLYGASTNFVGDLAALGRSVLFGTASSGAANQVLVRDLDVSDAASGTLTLLPGHTLGAADLVGSRIVFTARNDALPVNFNGSGDDDIWTLFTYEEPAGGGFSLTSLGNLPRKTDIRDASPVRALDRDGTTFLGDDDRVFWLQQNDAAGIGSEIHRLDFATGTISFFDIAPGPASGAGEFGDATFADGRLYFVGSEDGSSEERALWTIGAGLTPTPVTGTFLRDPFGYPNSLLALNGEVFFLAREDSTGFQRLFQVNDDGVTAEALALPGADATIFGLAALGSDLGFLGTDANGREQAFRVTPGSQPGQEGAVTQLTNLTGPRDFLWDLTLGGDGDIYFARDLPATGHELWVVDPAAPEGARLLADINLDPVPVGYEPQQVVAVPFVI